MVNKSYNGPGWWLAWSAAEVIGFGIIPFREVTLWLPVIIIIQNSMIVAGTVFLYIGVRRFFNLKVNLWVIVPVLAIFFMLLTYFLFFDNNIQIRSGLFSITLAIMSFITAQSFFIHKTKSIVSSSNFNAFVFIVHGGIFTYRALMIFTGTPVENFFTPSLFNLIPYLDALIVSLLWTFGLIIMLNQRLNGGLAEAKEDLQLIFNTSPDAAVITRLNDGMIVDVNEGYCTITGYTRDEIVGKSSLEINIWKNSDDRQTIVSILQEKGSCENFEARFLIKDQTEIFGLMSATVINLHDVPHIISITRDITGRKMDEDKLRISEEKFRAAFDNILEGVQIIGFDWKYIYLNGTAGLHSRRPKEELLGRTYLEVWPDGTNTNLFHLMEQTMKERVPLKLENEFFFPDRSAGWFDLSIQPSPEGLFILSIDITERKKAEIALRESEQKFRQHIMHLDEGFYSVTPEGTLLEHNEAFNRLLGFDKTEDMRGRHLPDFWVNPQKRFEYVEILKSSGYISKYPIDVKTKTGNIVNILASAHTVKDKDNQTVRIEGVFLDISERKREEQALKESEHGKSILLAKMNEAQKIALIGSWEWNMQTDEVWWSDECYRIFGVSRSDYVPGFETNGKYIHPDDLGRYNSSFEHSLKSHEPLDLKIRLLANDGRLKYCQVKGNPIYNDSGQPVCFSGTVMDITSFHHAEAMLVKANRVYAVISHINKAIVHLKDKNELFQEVCQIAFGIGKFQLSWIGLVSEEQFVVPVAYAGHEQDYLNQIIEISINDIPEGHGPTGIAIREGRHHVSHDIENDPCMILWKEEAIKHGYRSSIALPIKVFGKVIGSLNIYSDIPYFFDKEEIELLDEVTSDLGFAIEKFETEEELRLSAEKFKNVFEHAAVGKSMTYMDGSVKVNIAFCDMLGYSMEEMSMIKWQEITHADDIEEDTAVIESLINFKSEKARWVKRYIHKNGSMVWVDVSTVLQRDKQGKGMYFITTINDITNQVLIREKLLAAYDEIKDLNVTLEQRVAQRTAQLEASNKELEAFTYSVSHDLRAPLRHISGYVDLIIQRFHSLLPEQGTHYLDIISESANQMGSLIDDLLQFSKNSRQEMQVSEVDMNNLVQDVIQNMNDDCHGRNFKWVVAGLPNVVVDYSLMRLVWINLLSNAIKFTRQRKIARIEIGFHQDKNEFVFFIRDNGAGFDMRYAHKLFGVFQRMHATEEFEGTGIGLANVRRIILRHGGRTWAEAEVDKGATIFFSLPVVMGGDV